MSELPDDLLDLYFREVGSHPLLTAEDEVELAKEIESGREAERQLGTDGHSAGQQAELEAQVRRGHAAFDRFVNANLRLVIHEAARYARRSPLPLEELIQEGNLGLLRAVEKFDWRRGYRFSTYATWWIRQALQRGAARGERHIRLPSGLHRDLMKVRAARSRLVNELGRPPCLDELSDATGLTEADVRRLLEAEFSVTSLDTPVSDEEDGRSLGALVATASDAPAEEVIERLFTEGVLETLQRILPERSWYVLQRRYGLAGNEPATLQAVGKDLGISREAVRKIEQRALAEVRQELAAA